MSETNPIVDISDIIEKQKLSKFLVVLIVTSGIVTFFDGYDHSIIGYSAPYFVGPFHLTKLMVGKVFSAGLFGTCLGAVLFGYIGDKIGRRRAILLAASYFGVTTFAFALSTGYRSMLILRFLDGMATGGFLPLIWALNIEYSPKQFRATVVTLNLVGYQLGILACGPISVALIPRFGWQSVFIFGGVLTLIGTGLLVAYLPESIRFLASKRQRPELIAKILRRMLPDRSIPDGAQFLLPDEGGQGKKFKPALLFAGALRFITPLLWVAFMFCSLGMTCINIWTPMIFVELHYTRTDAAWAGAVATFAGLIASLLLMRFTDKFGSISVSAMPVLAVPMLLIAAYGNLSHRAFFMFYPMVNCFISAGQTGMNSIAGIFYPSSYRSFAGGVAASISKLGGAAGPLIGAWVLTSGMPPRHLFAVLAITSAIMAVCVFAMGRIHRRILGREALEAPSEFAFSAKSVV